MDKLEEYVVHPCEFGPLLHKYGLNISCLGELSKQVENNFVLKLLKSEAAVRSLKCIYRKKMQ